MNYSSDAISYLEAKVIALTEAQKTVKEKIDALKNYRPPLQLAIWRTQRAELNKQLAYYKDLLKKERDAKKKNGL